MSSDQSSLRIVASVRCSNLETSRTLWFGIHEVSWKIVDTFLNKLISMSRNEKRKVDWFSLFAPATKRHRVQRLQDQLLERFGAFEELIRVIQRFFIRRYNIEKNKGLTRVRRMIFYRGGLRIPNWVETQTFAGEFRVTTDDYLTRFFKDWDRPVESMYTYNLHNFQPSRYVQMDYDWPRRKLSESDRPWRSA